MTFYGPFQLLYRDFHVLIPAVIVALKKTSVNCPGYGHCCYCQTLRMFLSAFCYVMVDRYGFVLVCGDVVF